jgi:uncharacterized C2H2 Zn-finger protein
MKFSTNGKRRYHYVQAHKKKDESGVIDFPCRYCTQRFKTMGSKRYHMEIYHKKEVELRKKSQLFQCPTCLRYFRASANLKKHLTQAHKNTNMKPNKAPLRSNLRRTCNTKKSGTKLIASKSETNVVENDPFYGLVPRTQSHVFEGFKCPECANYFKSKGTLERHNRTMHQEKSKKNRCVNCGKNCITKRLFDRHKCPYDQQPNFQCPLCPAGYPKIFLLRKHLIAVHDYIDPTKAVMVEESNQQMEEEDSEMAQLESFIVIKEEEEEQPAVEIKQELNNSQELLIEIKSLPLHNPIFSSSYDARCYEDDNNLREY